ncbi:MAG: hypothetical protein ACYTEX_11310 [Planctomycetota bacterium]
MIGIVIFQIFKPEQMAQLGVENVNIRIRQSFLRTVASAVVVASHRSVVMSDQAAQKKIDECKRRIASIMEEAPWEQSKSCQQKAERERKALARKARQEKREKSGKPPPRPSEWQEQKALCKRLKKHGIDFFAPSPELGGEDVDPVRMAQFRSIGLKKGIPDLHLVDLADDGRPIVIEMKRTKLGMSSLTPSQKKWREIYLAKGWHHIIGFGEIDAFEKLQKLIYRLCK